MRKIKRIRLKRHYRRVGSSHRAEPGEYNIDDPRLHGWGTYLVQNDHADVIEYEDEPVVKAAPAQVEQPAEGTEEAEESDLEPFDPNTLSKDELVRALNNLGIDVDAIEGSGKGGDVLKVDLVAAYEEASGI